MQQVEQIQTDTNFDQMSRSYSSSLIEIKNHNKQNDSQSDNLSIGTISSCEESSFSDNDGKRHPILKLYRMV